MNDLAAAPKPETPDPTEALHAELDQVDRALLDLFARRLRLAEGVNLLNQGESLKQKLHPAQEIATLRGLIAAAPDPVEPEMVVELWRAILSANARRQGAFDVTVGGGTDPLRLFDIARRHFGARTRLKKATDPQTALLRAVEDPNVVAVVPWPAAPGVGSWWPALSESRFHKLQLIAGLPLRGPQSEDPEACVFARAAAEPAGDDITLMIVFDPHHRAQRALTEVGLKGREVARSEPRALLRIEGFVAVEDNRAAAMTRYGLDAVRVLGSYARV
ncbi:MAG: chorismate mutase [Alphaproteobacteria bacterium]